MTKMQMRRAIARDVIKQLGAALLVPAQGTYINTNAGPFHQVEYGADMQPVLLKTKRQPCMVCALGAGVVASIRLENNYYKGDEL